MAAALETLLELDGCGAAAPPEMLLKGGAVSVCDPQNECVNELLRCARFRLDSTWQRYYGSVLSDPLDPVRGARMTRDLISSVALDIPMLLALFLLMTVRADLVQTAVNPERLNRKRASFGRPPLLEHVEVSPRRSCGPRTEMQNTRSQCVAGRGFTMFAATSCAGAMSCIGVDRIGAAICAWGRCAAARSSCGCTEMELK